jgi:hypothetical protein
MDGVSSMDHILWWMVRQLHDHPHKHLPAIL